MLKIATWNPLRAQKDNATKMLEMGLDAIPSIDDEILRAALLSSLGSAFFSIFKELEDTLCEQIMKETYVI